MSRRYDPDWGGPFARRMDFAVAIGGILVLAAAAAGAAGSAWWHALSAPVAADRLAYQDVTVAMLALGLCGLFPFTSLILSLISRPATRHSSRWAGHAPVAAPSSPSSGAPGDRRTSPALKGWGGAGATRFARVGRRLVGRRGHQLPARCVPIHVVHTYAPGRATPPGVTNEQ